MIIQPLTFVILKLITTDSDGPTVFTTVSMLRVNPSITEIRGCVSSDWLLTTPLKGDDTAASKSGSSEGAADNNQQVRNDDLMPENRSLLSLSHCNPPLLNPEFDRVALGSCSMPRRR
jgi:hypothetical protein